METIDQASAIREKVNAQRVQTDAKKDAEQVVKEFEARVDFKQITSWFHCYENPGAASSGWGCSAALLILIADGALFFITNAIALSEGQRVAVLCITVAALAVAVVLGAVAYRRITSSVSPEDARKIANEKQGFTPTEEQEKAYNSYKSAKRVLDRQKIETIGAGAVSSQAHVPVKQEVPVEEPQDNQQPVVIVANGLPPCPRCGSRDVYLVKDTGRALSPFKAAVFGYSYGPVGAIVGASAGKRGKRYFRCNSCNKNFRMKN